MPSNNVVKTILLSGAGIQREAVAAALITPGFLVDTDANGDLIPHGLAGQETQAAFAVEYDLTGRDIDDNYAIGDQVIYHVLPEGARVNAVIVDGAVVAVNSLLASNGDGKLRVALATDFVVAKARQAVSPVGADGRAVVEVYKGRGIA